MGYQSGMFSGSAVKFDSDTLEMEYHALHPTPLDLHIERQSCGECGEPEPLSDDDTSEVPYGRLHWVNCDECSVWYHFGCAGVEDYNSWDDIWLCSKC